MENVGKVISYNLGAMLFYTLLAHALSGGDGAIIGALISYAHAGIILLIGILMAIVGKDKEKTTGGALILSALLIAVIGFSVCLGTLDLHFH